MSNKTFLVLFWILLMMAPTVWAAERYEISPQEFEKYKKGIEDPSPWYKNTEGLKKIIPPATYKKLTFDVEVMKNTWTEVVGFRAPDVVGKVAPEIKPGKYTYKDKSQFPFEKLMWKHMYDQFNPTPTSGRRHVGNFTEIEIVPTRQYYYPLPVAEATKKYMGTAKQDDQGYLIQKSYVAGHPFPRPEGKFKAQQILYSFEKHYMWWDSHYYFEHDYGFTGDLRQDFDALGHSFWMRTQGRLLSEPLGWLDKRAEEQGEYKAFLWWNLSPRDLFGNTLSTTWYIDPERPDLYMLYINSLRRVRRLSSSDTQDPALGTDQIYDDFNGWNQKMSPNKYPNKYEVIGEGEFLAPLTWDGSPYMSVKEGHILKNLQFERRPMWVVQVTSLDKSYVYSKRVVYLDKETLLPWFSEAYDQKGRLYRTFSTVYSFVPEMGLYCQWMNIALDHLDTHSTAWLGYAIPAPWVTRNDISLSGLVKSK